MPKETSHRNCAFFTFLGISVCMCVYVRRAGVLTDRCAAVQVPQVVQFICQFDQFGLMAAMRRMCHLLTLPLLFRETFVIGHLLNDTSHHRPELGLQFCRRGVCVLYRVVKQSSLRGRYRDRKGMEREGWEERRKMVTCPKLSILTSPWWAHTCKTWMSTMSPSWLRILATP